jgi:hypothetical protein
MPATVRASGRTSGPSRPVLPSERMRTQALLNLSLAADTNLLFRPDEGRLPSSNGPQTKTVAFWD